MNKQQIRANFRNSVFERDGGCCAMCGLSTDLDKLDAHHIVLVFDAYINTWENHHQKADGY